MSLRTALAALPDDRDTAAAVREIVTYFAAHPRTPIEPDRLVQATSLSSVRVEPVLRALASGRVLHCAGDPRLAPCDFEPDHVLALEVERYLRTAGITNVRLQSSVGRFRQQYGRK